MPPKPVLEHVCISPAYTAHKFQRLPLIFVSGTSHSQLICIGVPETFAVYGLKVYTTIALLEVHKLETRKIALQKTV